MNHKLKSRNYLLLLFALFMVLTLSSQKPTFASTKKNKKAHIAYEKTLKSLNKSWNKFYKTHQLSDGDCGVHEGATYFAYLDINKDGIDECIAYRHSDYEYNLQKTYKQYVFDSYALYTYYKGKVIKLSSCKGPYFYSVPDRKETVNKSAKQIHIYKNCKYITLIPRSSGTTKFYKIQKGKLKKVATGNEKYTYHGSYSNYTITYYINGKKVSKKTYSKYVGTKSATFYRYSEKMAKKKR